MAPTVSDGWVTTWPVIAEASHLMTKRLGPPYVAALMDDVTDGNISTWDSPFGRLGRVSSLMRRYAALPMDLADASLVLLAEHPGHGRILSTDERDFETYRWKQRKPLVNLLAG